MIAKLFFTFFSAAMLVGCSTITMPQSPYAGADLVVQNVTAIDAASGAQPNVDVVVAGDRIVSVVPTRQQPKSTNVRIVDGSGKFLIPGLWDAHVHLAFDPDIGHEVFFPLALRHGVTYLRDTGGHLDRLKEARSLASSKMITPDLYVSGPLIDGKKRVYAGQSATAPDLSIGVATAEQAVAEVDRLASQNVNFIKAYEMLSPRAFDALIQRAKTHNLPVTAHSPLSMTARQAITAGISDMQHLRNLELDCVTDPETLLKERNEVIAADDATYGQVLRSKIHRLQRHKAVAATNSENCKALISLMKAEGVSQTPTLTISRFLSRRLHADEDWQNTFQMMPETVARKWKKSAKRLANRTLTDSDMAYDAWLMTMVSELDRAGVSLLAGTDAPIGFLTPGASLHEELVMLVEAGLTPLAAIRAATIAPAEFLNLQDSQGRIAPNMQADLVLLGKNPMKDIQNIKTVELVVKDGLIAVRHSKKQQDRQKSSQD